jgi:hypothetical protein
MRGDKEVMKKDKFALCILHIGVHSSDTGIRKEK